MKPIRNNSRHAIHCCLASALLGLSACKQRDEKGTLDDRGKPSTDGASKQISSGVSAQISEADKLVKKGAIDEAAANLVKLQGKASQFTSAEGDAYRQTLSDTYSRALEAAQKGDPRGQAALDLIRATKPH